MIVATRPLSVTLPWDQYCAVREGSKRRISTRRNPRKDRYFQAKIPQQAEIKCVGRESFLKKIIRVEGTETEWHIHL